LSGREIIIHVLVQPRASKNEVVGSDEAGRLRVRVTAPPVEGAANKGLVKLLARHFNVPKSNITIEAGARGRLKRVKVTGL
jgi:uncharacterized protein (TIGR00251 family)